MKIMLIAACDITELDFLSINLFPAIRSIYDDANAGRLIGLQFDCSTGANRREVMRKVTDDRDLRRDLRREEYHVAGTNKVDITPYWLSVELRVPHAISSETIELTLPGTIRNLQGATLSSFDVSTFGSEAALGHAVNLLFNHVKSP